MTGRVNAMSGSTRPVRDEQDLRRIEFSLDRATDLIYWVDSDGRLLEANATAARRLGFTREQLLEMTLFDFTAGLTREAWPILLEAARRGCYQRERELVTRSGERFPVAINVNWVVGRGAEYHCVVARDISERKRAEEATRHSEDRFQAIIEQLSAGFFLIGADGLVQEWNPAMEQLTGFRRAEVIGRAIWDVQARCACSAEPLPAFIERARGIVLAALETGEAQCFGRRVLTEIRRADGEKRSVEHTVFPVRAEGRLNLGNLLQDVTEQERAQEALRESEERFRTIFRQGSIGISVLDADSRLIRVNRALCTMLGYEEDELLGRSILDITATADLDQSLQEIHTLLDHGRLTLQMDKRYRRKDGGLMWGHVSASVLRGSDGRVTGTVAMVQDISERKRAEEALMASQVQLGAAMDLADLASWEYDVDEGVFTFSDRFYALYGTTVANEGGYQMPMDVYAERFVHPLDRHMVAEQTRRAVETTDPGYHASAEHRMIRRDGRVRHIVVRIGIVKDQCGRTVKTYGANQDVTERKETEQALALAEEQLRQSQKMEAIGRLAGGIAHDFNNLLTAIIGNSELALQAMDPADPNRELVADIKEVGERAARLTRQILAFSRRQLLRPEALCLNDVVRRMKPLLERTLGEHVDLQVLLAPDLRPTMVDPCQLEQVLVNLALNARDAMPTGGELVIGTANVDLDGSHCAIHSGLKPGRYVLLAVSDTGCGMDEETKARIFEPFFTTKEVGKGTGLGLSTVFGIVSQSGGSISVHSAPQKGSTFKVYLPAAFVGDIMERDEPTEPLPHTGTGTILVVEDEAPVRDLVARILSRCGYEVLEAGSAVEADRLLAGGNRVLDLVLTDVLLPGGQGGREVAEHVHARQPGLPVIFMSGYTRDSAMFKERLGREADFLEKPFTPDGLLKKVREALDRAPVADPTRGAQGTRR